MIRILLVLILSTFSSAFSYDTILLNKDFLSENIAPFSSYLHTGKQNYSIAQITGPTLTRQFSPVHSDVYSFSNTPGSTWFTFNINNPTGQYQRLYLKIETPFIESAELYFQGLNNSGYQSELTGQQLSFSERPHQFGNLVIPFDARLGSQDLYLKITPLHTSSMKVRLVDELTILSESRMLFLLYIPLNCALFFAALFAAINYYRYRDLTSVWTTTVITGSLLNLSGWNGSIGWLISFIPHIETIAINCGTFLTLFGLAKILIAQRKRQSSWTANAINLFAWVLLVAVVASCTPLSKYLLPLQIMLVPASWALFALHWFERRTESSGDRLMLAGYILFAGHFTGLTLTLIGLISALEANLIVIQGLLIAANILVAFSSWLYARQNITLPSADKPNFSGALWPILRKLNHDIRGPINGVLGMTELLQDTSLSAHQQEFVNTLQSAGFSLLREADQLQNLIHLGLNRLPEGEEEFDLYDLAEDIVQPYSKIAHSKNIELVLDIAPELPSRYRGNVKIITQILSILLDNGLKYTEYGEVIIQVKPWHGQRVRFSISDTGPGMAKDTQERLFDLPSDKNPMAQTPKDVHLGLPICKYLVNLLGGQLSMNSELRMGTTFWVDMPLQSTLPKGFSRTSTDENALNGIRLMVVDDNMTCCKVIEHLAQNWGMSVITMSNAQSALANLHYEYHKHKPVDVLVLDQNMPSMTGSEMAIRVRQDPELNRDIVIIMLTGSDAVSAELEDDDLGVKHILRKPVSARTLKESLQLSLPEILQNRETHRAKQNNSYFF
ncbi:hybrid sensor histidine kinase/response regulator [Reinekea marinisedimentorum]|uniref:histidine kinase n=1 Tax=Reinekea marinisedimentorum TaxID=230495 RepID=A0A4R3I6Y0_9GAMM|nr:ATP-binding protein [Reinekea marinisedimentorum]TCS41746.1 signal transduction histidine kinase [Reinekea marinisedimentorum]